jgi:VanZ family protein
MTEPRKRPRARSYLAAAIAWAALLFALSQIPGPALAELGFDIWDKAAHAVAYAPLGFLVAVWLLRRTPAAEPRELFLRAALAAAIAALYGVTDEIHQSFVPGRQPSASDVAADLVGGAFGGFACALFAFRRKRWR